MVRDYSIKELVKANSAANRIIRDICYGSSYVLLEGKMVQSGACYKGSKNPRSYPNNNDSTSLDSFGGTCMLKKGDIYINRSKGTSNPFTPKTWPERVEIKENIAKYTLKKSFIQKGLNSNLEIPGYSNPTLNGKGYS